MPQTPCFDCGVQCDVCACGTVPTGFQITESGVTGAKCDDCEGVALANTFQGYNTLPAVIPVTSDNGYGCHWSGGLGFCVDPPDDCGDCTCSQSETGNPCNGLGMPDICCDGDGDCDTSVVDSGYNGGCPCCAGLCNIDCPFHYVCVNPGTLLSGCQIVPEGHTVGDCGFGLFIYHVWVYKAASGNAVIFVQKYLGASLIGSGHSEISATRLRCDTISESFSLTAGGGSAADTCCGGGSFSVLVESV